MSTAPDYRPPHKANRKLLLILAAVTVGMFGFGYLLVPFYDVLCRVTGLREIDAADQVTAVPIDAARRVRIEFDANVGALPWQFRPDTPIVDVHPGALTQVTYEVQNTADRPITGQAIPSYGPALAAQYFKKLECFCFRQQSFAPHETRRMPVVFLVDPKLPSDIGTITLSYTFFEVEGNRS